MSAEPKIEETVGDDPNWESDYSIDSNSPVPVSKKLKRDQDGRRSNTKHYEQKFRTNWTTHELLRNWIEPVESNEYMAHCKICDCVLKAKFSSLKTHSKSEQHLAAEKNCPKYYLEWKGEALSEPTEPAVEQPKPLIITKNINSILNDTIEARRSKVWTSANVRSMIHEYTALKNDFRDPKQKQKLVWERLAERLQDQGINVSAEDADKKWRNLKMTFKRIFYEEGRSEQSKSQWEFYDMLLGLFSLEDNNVPVRKSRTISPPRDEGKAYELDIHDDNQIKITTPKITKVRTTPMKRKVVEEYVEDIGQYQVEELQNVDAESMTIEDHKPQIVQSFDIDFLESRPEYSETSVVEVHRVKKETTLRRNPLSPTHEMPVFNQSTQPPIWFKNFQKRYDSDTKLILTKLNNIREVQNTQQNCLNILEHKMEMFEETLLRVVGTDQLEESGDEAGPEAPIEEADMVEFYIEETN